jgi:hypothetical protein
MKKIFTLLFFIGAVTSAFAQTSDQEKAKRILLSGGADPKTDRDTRNSRDVIIGGERRIYNRQGTNYPYPGRYTSSDYHNAQADQVNRDYDAKINSIRNNRQLSGAEKERIIRDLNNDRYNNGNRYNKKKDRWNNDDKRYKSNNGNHYGWEKGKGNPHKNGGKSKGKGRA